MTISTEENMIAHPYILVYIYPLLEGNPQSVTGSTSYKDTAEFTTITENLKKVKTIHQHPYFW